MLVELGFFGSLSSGSLLTFVMEMQLIGLISADIYYSLYRNSTLCVLYSSFTQNHISEFVSFSPFARNPSSKRR